MLQCNYEPLPHHEPAHLSPFSPFFCSARHIVTVLWPYPFGWLSLLVPLIALFLLFYNVMFLLKAGCIDPGFIPRATAMEGEYFKRLADRDGNVKRLYRARLPHTSPPCRALAHSLHSSCFPPPSSRPSTPQSCSCQNRACPWN